MVKVSLGREDLESFVANDIGFYGLDLNRISSVLIVQIMQIQARRVLDTYQIMQEVKYLEGLVGHTATEKHQVFKHKPLKGLTKKHFMNALFVLKNLAAHFSLEHDGNTRLDRVIRGAFDANESGYVDDDFVNKLTYDFVIGGIRERAKTGLTGEWIIFQEHLGKNYYLTLAAHDEGDEEIYKRVLVAYEINFPFLQDHLLTG